MPDQLIQPQKGMVTDLSLINLDSENYTFAKNAVLTSTSGNQLNLKNETSNFLYVTFPRDYVVIGTIAIEELDRFIYFLVNPKTGKSEIGEVLKCTPSLNNEIVLRYFCGDCGDLYIDEPAPLETIQQKNLCKYRKIINANCLNFSINHPVYAEYKVTNCSVYLYFTDNFNERRFVYLDINKTTNELDLQDKFKVIISRDSCGMPIYSSELDCNKITYHPKHKPLCIGYKDTISNGDLRAGVYQALVAYSDRSGNTLTSYSFSSNGVPLFSKKTTFETDYRVNRGLQYEIENLDLSNFYEYYNVVIAATVNNFTNFYLLGTFPVTQNVVNFTSINDLIKLTAEDVFFKKPFYKTAYNVTKSNDYLFFSGVNEFKQLNLQQAANQIKLNWQTKAVREGIYSDERTAERYRTYHRDETYAFGIVYGMDNGEETCAFHIPGRLPTPSDLTLVTGDDVREDFSCFPGAEPSFDKFGRPILVTPPQQPRWKVYNTASVAARPHVFSEYCDDSNCWEYGEFAYYESVNRYPNNPDIWGELCNKPIRHHKFPDSLISHIHDGNNTSSPYEKSNIIYPIGVKVNHQSVIDGLNLLVTQNIISLEDKNRIKYYRIVRGNRVGNESIKAKGLLYDMWKYNKFNEDYYYSNFPFNDLRENRYISNNPNTYEGSTTSPAIPSYFDKTSRYTFHSPDTHFSTPTLGNILKLETEEYGQSQGYFTQSRCEARQKFISTFSSSLALSIAILTMLTVPLGKESRVYGTESIKDGNKNTRGLEQGEVTVLGSTVPDPLSFAGKALSIGLTFIKEFELNTDIIKSFLPYKNHAVQFNSIGYYNNFLPVQNNNRKIRPILKSEYLGTGIQSIDEITQNIKVNNYDRESSVFIKIDNNKSLPNTTNQDQSRYTMGTIGFGEQDLDKKFYAPVSSYYCSIKNDVVNQYGDVCSIEYLPTESCPYFLDTNYTNCELGVFGGDTYITRFAFKRKIPFFLQNRCKFDKGADVRYQDLGNVGYPNFYYNTGGRYGENFTSSFGRNFGSTLQNFLNVDKTRLDAKRNTLFNQNGFIYLHSYGIPHFLVESGVNTDLRHGENTREKDFYPRQPDLYNWLEEENVSIKEDNYYFYNTTYSKQNRETPICVSCFKDLKEIECSSSVMNRVIYSGQDSDVNVNDNWLIFKTNDYKEFPLSNGKLISVDGVENDKLLVRFQNTSKLFSAYNTLKTDGLDIQVGNGGLFEQKPIDFSNANLGYAGSQHRAILKTKFGTIWVDAKRGEILKYADGKLQEISNKGKKLWFQENLPFKLLRHYPEIDIEQADNNFKDIGITMGFDKIRSRVLITKLDFEPKSKNIKYNKANNYFYIIENGLPKEINIRNTQYFENKSWTISFDLYNDAWASYHSYIPNFYLQDNNNFYTGKRFITHESLWVHDLTNRSYQVFYGKLYPFIIELLSKKDINFNTINSVQFALDVLRYHNEFDWFANKQVTFNRAIIGNKYQTSGNLILVPRKENNLQFNIEFPKYSFEGKEILVTNRDNKWTFNDFFNVVRSDKNNIPIWNFHPDNADKELNLSAINYNTEIFKKEKITQDMCFVRLINDKYSNYNFVFNYAITNQTYL